MSKRTEGQGRRMIVGIDNDKLKFIATDDGQLVVTLRNLTEAIADREKFLNACVTHCKDCKYAKCIEQNDDWLECSHDKRVMHGDGFCSWAERKEE